VLGRSSNQDRFWGIQNGTVTPLFKGGVPMKTGAGIYLPSSLIVSCTSSQEIDDPLTPSRKSTVSFPTLNELSVSHTLLEMCYTS